MFYTATGQEVRGRERRIACHSLLYLCPKHWAHTHFRHLIYDQELKPTWRPRVSWAHLSLVVNPSAGFVWENSKMSPLKHLKWDKNTERPQKQVAKVEVSQSPEVDYWDSFYVVKIGKQGKVEKVEVSCLSEGWQSQGCTVLQFLLYPEAWWLNTYPPH